MKLLMMMLMMMDDYHNYRYYGAKYSCTQTVVPKYLYRDYSKATVYTLWAHRALFSLAQKPMETKVETFRIHYLRRTSKVEKLSLQPISIRVIHYHK